MSTNESPGKNNQPSLVLMSLPEDIIVECIARVPRSYYPILSFVSKYFRSLVTSPALYSKRRSLPGRSESCLYVAISKNQTSSIHWYILCHKPNNKFWLAPIPSLPPMPLNGSYVVVGSSIIGFYERGLIRFSVSRIDCQSHTVQPLTSMPMAVSSWVSELIDGNIYVNGGSNSSTRQLILGGSNSDDIIVYDTEAETWAVSQKQGWETSGSIYMRGNLNSFVYELKEGIWKPEEILHPKEWSNSCMIDDVSYYYDVHMNSIRMYDPKKMAWGVVKGVELGQFEGGSWSYTANYGGNLVVFIHKENAVTETTEIWCAEIAVERREGGEIWGRVDWCDLVLDGNSHIMKCLVVEV